MESLYQDTNRYKFGVLWWFWLNFEGLLIFCDPNDIPTFFFRLILGVQSLLNKLSTASTDTVNGMNFQLAVVAGLLGH